jgi:DNA-binding transcriptional LysR family regulator
MSERPLPRQIFGQLATFIAVAETLSFRHAAEFMGRSQPAITTHIQQLEDYLGITLFVRTIRHVRLTAVKTPRRPVRPLIRGARNAARRNGSCAW